jgi:uncharacterized protein YyaL (SSP411 family)
LNRPTPNRLGAETSPYLQQHAHNPVDWYPWGPDALEKARAEDKPILLSIGYSACHWCHVMERESFEDPLTATLMNEGFVNIKVDREERPDLDGIYMRAIQSLVGRGGWPLTAFLTPDGRAFYGGTYFPPTARHGMPSFRQVLDGVMDAYTNRRDEVEKGAQELLSMILAEPQVELSKGSQETLDLAFSSLRGQFDARFGGFGQAPKFPQPTTLEFLLRYHHSAGNDEALQMVLTTLRGMARGGMRDQLGGGFHRYSVDAVWLVPHFEKMLYDNGLLARVYLHAFLLTGEEEFKETVTSTLDYLLDDLTSPEGGFYSARDADSEGEEGIFYIWSREELNEILGPTEGPWLAELYGVTSGGNFEGRNILHLSRGLGEEAEARDLTPEELKTTLVAARDLLLEKRSSREAPFRDEKVLVSWNSFVLRALAESGIALGRPDYLEVARKNARFLLDELRTDEGLLRSWKEGPGKVTGFLEDYAGLGNALLTLHEATLEAEWIEEARWLLEKTEALFWDREKGLFYDTPVNGEELIVRPRVLPDAATPSGHSLAVEFFQRGAALFGSEPQGAIATRSLAREEGSMARFPSAFGRLLSILTSEITPSREVVILGDPQEDETQALLATAHEKYRPDQVVLGGLGSALPPLPLLEGRTQQDGKPTAYVCRDFTCSAPVQDPEALRAALEEG